MKVLTIEPPQADLRLREDLALLADCALPTELRVSTLPRKGRRFKPKPGTSLFSSHTAGLCSVLCLDLQVGRRSPSGVSKSRPLAGAGCCPFSRLL